MAKLLVTGGAGFIGSNLVDELVRLGHQVLIIDNLSGGKRENVNRKAKFYFADVTNIKQIKPLFRGVDYVFHLAALPRVQFSIEHPLESDAANVRGTLNVLVASADAGVKRVIYSASSSACKAPSSPNSPCIAMNTKSAGRSKAERSVGPMSYNSTR